MFIMKNITFLTGYYGSGKSEVAVNIAVQKKLDMVVDLDIINPYFRSREMEDELTKLGIKTISSDLDYKTHVDLPFISRKIFMPFHNQSIRAVYDLGGNDLGAKLMRQFDDYHSVDVDLFLVINIYRQESANEDLILKLINKIEGMSGFKVTGLINNSNLLRETTIQDILEGNRIVKNVSEITGLPIIYTTVWEKINLLDTEFAGELLRLKLYFRKDWL